MAEYIYYITGQVWEGVTKGVWVYIYKYWSGLSKGYKENFIAYNSMLVGFEYVVNKESIDVYRVYLYIYWSGLSKGVTKEVLLYISLYWSGLSMWVAKKYCCIYLYTGQV